MSLHPVEELRAISRTFSRRGAREKARLLGRIDAERHVSARRLRFRHDTLLFMRAYPDDADVLRRVDAAVAGLGARVSRLGTGRAASLTNSGLAGTCNESVYSYRVLQRLARVFPGCLDIDWNAGLDSVALVDALNLAVAPAETRGLEDEFTTLREWLGIARSRAGDTDLEVVLRRIASSTLPARTQTHVYETCNVPVRYRLTAPGSARAEATIPRVEPFYQKRAIARARFALAPRIRRALRGPARCTARAGRGLLDVALAALSSRNLEIHPLINANPADVTRIDGERGLTIVVAGVLPEFRAALEAELFFLIGKNGVPVAYGPAIAFAGACEMGINLFPEFRGGEIRFIYAELMRVLYHLAGVRYFFLTSYGMGDGNPEALRSGAFWFYRKLGFRAADPDIEALARAEEARMKRRPGYRSSMAMLRELSCTAAYLDLSAGRYGPVDFEALGARVTGMIARDFGGDTLRASRECLRRACAALGIRNVGAWRANEKASLSAWAPVLALVPRMASWPAADRASLVRMVRGRASCGELEYARQGAAHARLRRDLRAALR